jgi:hypothetical protein
MKKSTKYFTVAAGIAVTAVAIFLFSGSSSVSEKNDLTENAEKTMDEQVKLLREGDPSAVTNFIGDEKARENIKKIITQFEKDLRFPLYSRPIDENSYDMLHPHVFIPVERPFPDNDNLRYDLVLPKQIMFHGEPVSAVLRVTSASESLPQISSVKGRLYDDERGHKLIAEFNLHPGPAKTGSREFSAEYTPKHDPQMGNNLTLAVTFSPAGYGDITVTAPFTYAAAAAGISGIGTSRVEGAHLIIPVNLNVQKPGDFRVTGNLHSAGSDRPLINAFGVANITGSTGTVEIKIHAVALREKWDPGPYILKTFTIERMPTMKEPMLHGSGEDKEFEIPRRDLKEYSNEKYVNEDEQKKLQMLKNFM